MTPQEIRCSSLRHSEMVAGHRFLAQLLLVKRSARFADGTRCIQAKCFRL